MRGRLGLVVILSCICVGLRSTNGAKILGILPSAGWSHYAIGEGLMKALSRAGHDVTVVGAHRWKEAPDNYHAIELKELVFNKGGSEPDLFEYRNDPYLKVLYLLYKEIGPGISELILTHPKVQKLLGSNESFDAVIVECFASDVLYGFAQHFKAPLITLSSFGASLWTNELVGTPYPYSQIPHIFLSYTDRMTFWERFINALVWNVDRFYYNNVFLPQQEQMYSKYFPNATQSLQQVRKNTSLVLLNQHFSLSYPHPYATNMIEIGGIQMEDTKTLPEDLQTFMDNSEHGIIYFSMGSMLKGCKFPEEKRNAFIGAFSKLKENVLWKYENISLPNKPQNVLIKPWMPQNDILSHPNLKLFITHGGLLGSTEALYHGKPMVGVPIYGDQRLNMARAKKAGYGIALEYEHLTEESILTAIRTVLDDPAYAKSAQTVSERYRDQPMRPAETAVYWVEYVIRHRGAPQLHSAAVELSFIEYNLLDVYGLMLLFAGLVLTSVFMLAKNLFKLIGILPSRDSGVKNKQE